jgi:glycosyltransferase involved in cell wall biosynthesis
MSTAWVSFCISTFKRPEFLRVQLALLLRQTYPHFEIVISDNDPLETGRMLRKNLKIKELNTSQTVKTLA